MRGAVKVNIRKTYYLPRDILLGRHFGTDIIIYIYSVGFKCFVTSLSRRFSGVDDSFRFIF